MGPAGRSARPGRATAGAAPAPGSTQAGPAGPRTACPSSTCFRSPARPADAGRRPGQSPDSDCGSGAACRPPTDGGTAACPVPRRRSRPGPPVNLPAPRPAPPPCLRSAPSGPPPDLASVVFPAPLGPTSATSCPAGMLNVHPVNAHLPPYRRPSPTVSMTFMPPHPPTAGCHAQRRDPAKRRGAQRNPASCW